MNPDHTAVTLNIDNVLGVVAFIVGMHLTALVYVVHLFVVGKGLRRREQESEKVRDVQEVER